MIFFIQIFNLKSVYKNTLKIKFSIMFYMYTVLYILIKNKSLNKRIYKLTKTVCFYNNYEYRYIIYGYVGIKVVN